MMYNENYLNKIIDALQVKGSLNIDWHSNPQTCHVYDLYTLCLALEIRLRRLVHYSNKDGDTDFGKVRLENNVFILYHNKEKYAECTQTTNLSNIHQTFENNFISKKKAKADYSPTIIYLLWELFSYLHIPLPEDSNGQIPSEPSHLYSILYSNRTSFALINWDVVCSDFEDDSLKVQVVRFFFDISDNTAIDEARTKLAEWKCINPNKITDKNNVDYLYETVQDILRTAKTLPMYEYLLSKDPTEYRDDICEIFKHTAYRKIDNTLVLQSPVASISKWMTERVRSIVQKEIFTVYDFLSFAGCLAAFVKTKTYEQYVITPPMIDEFKTNPSYWSTAKTDSRRQWSTTEDQLLEAWKKSPFVSDSDGSLRFKIRPYRLILAGFSDAERINVNHENLNPQQILERYIEPYFPTSSDKDDNVRLDHVSFHQNHDSYIFYVMSLLYNLNSGIRRELIRQMCTNAKNFSVPYRLTQICYIYILTNILSSELPLCSAQRDEIFRTAFSQTLYEFQASHWKYLDKSSRYYREEVIRTVKAACSHKNKPESSESNDSHKNDNQPYYMLLYGLLISEEYLTSDRVENDTIRKKTSADLKNLKEAVQFVDQELPSDRKVLESSSEFFLKYAAFLQSQTWYPSDGLKIDQSVLIHDLHEMVEIASCWFKAHSRPSAAMAQLTFGVQLLGYCLADLVNYHHLNSNDIWGSNETEVNARQTNALTALVYADYWMRHTNAKYPAKIIDGHLLCGSYRAICAIEFESVTEKVILTENMLGKYRSWLSAESNNTATRRYAYLMALLLHHTDFPLESDTYRTRTLLADLLQELRTLLKEKDYSMFLQYDLGAGMKKLTKTPFWE